MLVSDVLTSVRDILADSSKARWPDATLIRLLNDGINNFVLQTSFAKAKAYIELEQEIAVYDISSYAIGIDRIQYISTILAAKTEEEMDLINPLWEDEVGEEPKYIIFENLRQGVFKVYPKVIAGAANVTVQNQVYGGLIDISFTDGTLQLPNLSNIAFTDTKYLTVYYVERPTAMATLTDVVKINEVYKAALVAYISGQALRLDQDTLNRQFGAEQLKIYDTYVAQALSKDAKANNTFHNRQTSYKGFS